MNLRDYVFKLDFPGVDPTPENAELYRTSFSESLNSLFIYSPQQVGEVCRTSFFQLPASAGTLTVHAVPWHVKSGGAQIKSVDLQIQAPWKGLGKLTLKGVLQS